MYLSAMLKQLKKLVLKVKTSNSKTDRKNSKNCICTWNSVWKFEIFSESFFFSHKNSNAFVIFKYYTLLSIYFKSL